MGELTTLRVASMSRGFQMPRAASITRRPSPEGSETQDRSARVTKPPFLLARVITEEMIESRRGSAVGTRLSYHDLAEPRRLRLSSRVPVPFGALGRCASAELTPAARAWMGGDVLESFRPLETGLAVPCNALQSPLPCHPQSARRAVSRNIE